MIGAGVFLSAGFMVQDLAPQWVLLAWIIGAVLAASGARAYGELARLIPRSGGEYRYLSDLVHPFLGYLAGWASLLVGFSAPIAIDALAIGAFANTLVDGPDPRVTATVVIVGLTAVHAASLRASSLMQNMLILLKALVVLGFLAVALAAGQTAWPGWEPTHSSDGFPMAAFAVSLIYVAYTFSGWNAAAYAASEFRNPARDVPRAMVIGCLGVGVLYLGFNWVFVANLTPEQALAATDEASRVTLGHLVMGNLTGPRGAATMSVVVILVLLSAMSALLFIGPRVLAAMARDGFVPRGLAGKDGKPPVGSVIVQGALALVLVYTHTLQQVLENLGIVLTLMSALTALALFRVRFGRMDLPRPSPVSLAASGIFVLSGAWILWFGFSQSPVRLAWIAGVTAAAAVAWALTRSRVKLR